MFFSAYIGTDAGVPHWREALMQHAGWLGLRARIDPRRLGDGRSLSLGWLERTAAAGSRGGLGETEQPMVAGTLVFDGVTRDGDANAATFTASLSGAEIRVAVPPASPQQFYYARTRHGYVFGDDMRLFPRLMNVTLDERAVYALLRYGAIPPPFTLYTQVQRIPNGHVLRLPGAAGEPMCTPVFRLTDLLHRDDRASQPDRWVSETLDAVLARVPASAVLYFSGGVDSGLLAARLGRLGRNDVRLLNYSFGPEDEESRLALRVASRLGFECHQISHDLRKVGDVLERLGTDYSFPFGDVSAIPTNILVHESLPLAGESRTVVEGTGADGAFGLGAEYRKWKRVYAVPRPLRRWAEGAYRGFELWKYKATLERAGCLLSKSVQLSLGHAVVAQNALERIAYTTPDDVQAELEQAIQTSVEVMSAGTAARDQLSLLDLVLVCAGRMAPKSFDPLRAQGVRPLYPFLHPAMVSVSSSLSWEAKCTAGQDKALLKRLLVCDIPPAWVYRPKTGFTRPARSLFALAPVQEYLHEVVLSRHNALLDYCRPGPVRRLVDRSRHRSLSVGAYNFLWALTFTSGWLGQSRAAPHGPLTPRQPDVAYEAAGGC